MNKFGTLVQTSIVGLAGFGIRDLALFFCSDISRVIVVSRVIVAKKKKKDIRGLR